MLGSTALEFHRMYCTVQHSTGMMVVEVRLVTPSTIKFLRRQKKGDTTCA
jgi:hypothetical protein